MDVMDLVRPEWPPLAHVRRGWDALTPQERADVQRRVDAVMAAPGVDPERQTLALRHFFGFLAQVETIAIEIPLRFLPHAPDELQPLLRAQLVDEVFHSILFARLAHELALPEAQPSTPLESAERLLDRIRGEADLALSATLLNLVAEGWIENLFRHALTWGVADPVFAAVLEDESRHVDEAPRYMAGLDLSAAASAVEALEVGLTEVTTEPQVALSILHIAGNDGYRRLVEDLQATHRKHLTEAGLEPSAAWRAMEEAAQQAANDLDDPDALLATIDMPDPVPDTPWRMAARRVWDTPRDPTMQGDFDVAVGHVPRKLLTPVIVAALGQAWAENPRLNRVIHQSKVYQLKEANVGVRVLVADDELATVVITQADRRSIQDIARMLQDGVAQLRAARDRRVAQGDPATEPLDDRLAALGDLPPTAFSVALSNPGKFGIVRGAGAFSGMMAPSTDLTVGRRRRLPVWKGVYVPRWHVNFGALQDHRIFDGREAGMAMDAIQAALSKASVKAILRRPDTLPADDPDGLPFDEPDLSFLPPEMRFLSVAGLGKYLPIALGGAGLAIGGSVGGWFLYQELARRGVEAAAGAAGTAAQTAQAGATSSAPSTAPEIMDAHGDLLEPVLADGRPRCQGLTKAGTQCRRAGEGGFCVAHR